MIQKLAEPKKDARHIFLPRGAGIGNYLSESGTIPDAF